MKKCFWFSFFLLVILFSCTPTKNKKIFLFKNDHTNTLLEKNIIDIINKTDPNINYGIIISSLKNNKVLFNKNADRHFMPASTLKIITLASALHYLGPYFRFKTGIYTDEINKNGSIKNIYIKGSGDPSFNDKDLYTVIQELKQKGIKAINGSIFIDDEVFDDAYWAKGFMLDDLDRAFSAPVSGLNFCYNRIIIKSTPSLDKNHASLVLTPNTDYLKVTSKINMQEGSKDISYQVLNKNNKNEGLNLNSEIVFNGRLGRNSDDSYHLFSVSDPALFLGTTFKKMLNENGIKSPNNIITKKTPNDAKLLALHISQPLAEGLIDFTKFSNNLANNALLKAIAYYVNNKPGNFNDGLKLIHKFLQDEVKIDTKNLITADAAGLSRYNLMTPTQMMKVLTYSANQFLWGAEFIAALPIGGEDGNLNRRFLKGLKGYIRAKSGTMSGINNLAGFMNVGGERLAFVIMMNGFVGPISKYSKLQEDILGAILDNGPKAYAGK